MLSYVCLFALVATASCANLGFRMTEHVAHPDNRIVGGADIDISQVPYQISLQVGNFHSCGGSIIGSRWVLTASHCLENQASWSRLNVRVGSSYSNQGGQYIRVASVHMHPNYNPANAWHSDIAVLELADNIQFNQNVMAVRLPSLNAQYPIGVMAQASGWGRLSEGGATPLHLQGVRIPINDPGVCEFVYGSAFQRDVHLCAASMAGGQSTCQGDSGGPLVSNAVQYGIVSWAAGCAAPNHPTVFANVANLRQFVTDVTGI